PMVDISVDPRWGRVSESAGEDPFLGSQIARARVRGFQGKDLQDTSTLLACVKHFAAYGAPQAGRDYHTVDMSDRTLRDMYLPPYKAAIEEGVGSVMTAFNEVDGIPATASSYLMTDILRKEWGFNGFVVTDYTAVEELIPHGVAADEKEAAFLALKAGVDMDMQSSSFREYLKPLVEEGKVKESEIDKAVKRILEAKFALGLFEDPYRYFDSEREKNLLMHQDHLDLAYETALHTMVLLKNSPGVLPLSHGESLAVIGPLANSQRDLLGSWIADGKWDSLKTILEALKEENKDGVTHFANGCGFDDTDRSGFPEAMKVARSANKIILVMGEPWDWSGEASSRTNIDLPEIQKEMIREISSLGKPVVLVLLNGRPLALEEEYEFTDAILEAWYPGTMGAKAIADVIFGNFNPSGKLPMTFPRNLGQVPIHYNMKNTGRPYEPEGPEQKYRSRYIDSSNEPLFPFGYGLSYTSFKYDEIRLGASQLKTGNDLKINVIITNTGKREGTEVVQLYIRDLVGSVTRPVKELKGFRKILLQPGESKEIEFLITSKDLSFYRADMTFGTEPGEFEVFVGGNSRDVISAKFQLLE
ncbi:MAG: glycoside hydrolase family 3 C-terminal domain-containing protein, partial [Bacteroidales bacterium]|nr:glycoside hydrolase family 3 C-terminal domain-containing protein [Bacteroidales bacterium]